MVLFLTFRWESHSLLYKGRWQTFPSTPFSHNINTCSHRVQKTYDSGEPRLVPAQRRGILLLISFSLPYVARIETNVRCPKLASFHYILNMKWLSCNTNL
jgi:hypothetical protein